MTTGNWVTTGMPCGTQPKMDPGQLENMPLKPDGCINEHINAFQRKWLEETGTSSNYTDTNRRLFQMMLKKSLPKEVRDALDEVVGLSNMDWAQKRRIQKERTGLRMDAETNEHSSGDAADGAAEPTGQTTPDDAAQSVNRT
ncbi:hypothetical protein GN956_G17644 [Arapaima gigas]